MDNADHPLRAFLRDESGEVTVNWVVLTSSVVAFGLAATGIVVGGVQYMSEDTDETIRDRDIQTSFADMIGEITDLFGTDFSGGADGWTGGTVASLDGFGEVLRIAGGEAAALDLPVPDGASSATITFDLIGGDDLDGDTATVSIGGVPISIYRDDHGNVSVASSTDPGIDVQVTAQYLNRAAGAGTHGKDSRATYAITVTDPASNLLLSVRSDADDGVSNEFYAIDDVSITTR